MADWRKIKTEYITTDTSYRKLAKKYGVNYQSICARSKEEKWREKHEQHTNKTITKALEKIENRQAEKIASVEELADQLLQKVELAIMELDRQIVKRTVKTKTIEYNNAQRPDKPTQETVKEEERIEDISSIIDRQGLKQIASALRDLKEVKMLKTELDRKEQEARIANLQKQAAAEDNKLSAIEIVFAAGPEEWNE